MGEIEGPILKALISFMYGNLAHLPKGIKLPLFLAADAHQVRSSADDDMLQDGQLHMDHWMTFCYLAG